MKVDTEIKLLGIEVLNRYLGVVDTERFIALIQREKFDYTKWRENLFAGMSGEDISRGAMEFQNRRKKKRTGKNVANLTGSGLAPNPIAEGV